jgi:UDP-N-acetylglucosamine--N-acetylmuramyl-(pentapeptide) pyrophosphoryl-undecaprenol N-acetylglucosamine transferase
MNIRDSIRVISGFVQACLLLRELKPDVVFLKGGFVGVPTGLAARLLKIPVVTHDSDIMPGLANRIAGRHARVHATAMPAEHYAYPQERVRHVGVLVSTDYQPVTTKLRATYRNELELPADAEVLFVTGGSLGSRNINAAIARIASDLLNSRPKLHIVHQTGKGNDSTYQGFEHPRLYPMPFLKGMHRYSGAADVIVTRAGANTLAEFGIQRKACIVIPHPHLTGGHQVKNAEYLNKQQAAVVVSESDIKSDPAALQNAIVGLFDDSQKREKLGSRLNEMAMPDAARKLAIILLEAAKK